ncbi:nitrilase-related carbon-nitrogen hydrolase [Providencia vermicola]|uniref:Carbon-nitrogen hydrolase n=2 Tax=Providencia stuartii TaxID=588 RepID=A0AAI9I0R7_PROST|nr:MULTISPECIES: nitrilase-related carbon-nitrogen hydrolase [Providencia]ELR5036497.1 carbon-nitrogen hydrolase [Providencia stuartii]ELR5122761.1 carbon-nitrogen hydrolase [Providencia stuartii]ELR5144016.1 carbon-nitrogen hydrolase [Providencia stuartii]ELR5293059.1 carbon-nitrogen hydrolase [Providencia stuartii]ELZ5940828.1 carbon-nitrogen hydrolase [Providencia stuartii]
MNNLTVKKSSKVAAVDFVPAWGDLEGNIRRLVEAAEKVAAQGVDYAVFPETAVSGYLFSDSAELAPYLDTIPGKTTEAILPVLARTGMYMSVGIAERDTDTGIAYNSAVLMGPEGIIGKYRKIGLNSQDQKVFAPGNTGVNTFDTPIGRIALLICYDDTYWQYVRLAALEGAQILGWHSVSDRMMPNATPAEMLGDHSTVAHVQHMSAFNGMWVICATRSGIETNPITHGQLYYNGGSSVWAPSGHKVAQSPVLSPLELEPGLNGIYSATIDLDEADKQRNALLAKRRPELYFPTLAFHRSPTDANATTTKTQATLIAAQWEKSVSDLSSVKVEENALLVLPELSALPYTNDPNVLLTHAEKQGGAFEQALGQIASEGKGYVVGSYPEIDVDKLYHTVVLAGPAGDILARYRVTHLNERDKGWASAGHSVSVTTTPIGRIALAAAHELEVPELGGLYSTLRADIIAAPAGLPSDLRVEIDSHLYSVDNPPTGRADFIPYAIATLNQLWVVCGGRSERDFTSAAIYGPEPVVLTPTLTAERGAADVRLQAQVPAPYTWINQERLISGQQAIWFPPLVS